jgi:hypothetical protein
MSWRTKGRFWSIGIGRVSLTGERAFIYRGTP